MESSVPAVLAVWKIWDPKHRTCFTNAPSLLLFLSNSDLWSCTVFLSTYLSPASQCHDVNRLEKKKKKSDLLTVAHAACGIPQTHPSMLVKVRISKATLKLGMAGINWAIVFNENITYMALQPICSKIPSLTSSPASTCQPTGQLSLPFHRQPALQDRKSEQDIPFIILCNSLVFSAALFSSVYSLAHLGQRNWRLGQSRCQ